VGRSGEWRGQAQAADLPIVLSTPLVLVTSLPCTVMLPPAELADLAETCNRSPTDGRGKGARARSEGVGHKPHSTTTPFTRRTPRNST